MFDQVSQKLTSSLTRIRGGGRITEKNIEQAIKEIRLSLLEADVNFKVVKDFINEVKRKSLGEKVLKNIDAGLQFTKIVQDEMTCLLGGETSYINLTAQPSIFFLVGLQGAGKTTTCAKLAFYIRQKFQKRSGFLPLDLRRPAAIEQLKQLGRAVDLPVFPTQADQSFHQIFQKCMPWVQENFLDILIVDTAGRLQIDEILMDELKEQKKLFNPHEILLVADCMLGQESLSVAQGFDQLNLTGIVLTKADGDARGGCGFKHESQYRSSY